MDYICAATEENVPSHTCAQLRHRSVCAFPVRPVLAGCQDSRISIGGERKFWSESADTQVNLSLHWAHISEGSLSHVELVIKNDRSPRRRSRRWQRQLPSNIAWRRYLSSRVLKPPSANGRCNDWLENNFDTNTRWPVRRTGKKGTWA